MFQFYSSLNYGNGNTAVLVVMAVYTNGSNSSNSSNSGGCGGGGGGFNPWPNNNIAISKLVLSRVQAGTRGTGRPER